MGIYKKGFDYKYSLDKDVLLLKIGHRQYKFKIENSELLENVHDIATLLIKELRGVEEKQKASKDDLSHYARLLLATLNICEKHTKLEKKYAEIRNILEELQGLKTDLKRAALPPRAAATIPPIPNHRARAELQGSVAAKPRLGGALAAHGSQASSPQSAARPVPPVLPKNAVPEKTAHTERSTEQSQDRVAESGLAGKDTVERSAAPAAPSQATPISSTAAAPSTQTGSPHSPSSLRGTANRGVFERQTEFLRPEALRHPLPQEKESREASSGAERVAGAATTHSSKIADVRSVSSAMLSSDTPKNESEGMPGEDKTDVPASSSRKQETIVSFSTCEFEKAAKAALRKSSGSDEESGAEPPATSTIPALSSPAAAPTASVTENTQETPVVPGEQPRLASGGETIVPPTDGVEPEKSIAQAASQCVQSSEDPGFTTRQIVGVKALPGFVSLQTVPATKEVTEVPVEPATGPQHIAGEGMYAQPTDMDETDRNDCALPLPQSTEVTDLASDWTARDIDVPGPFNQQHDQVVPSDEYQLPLLSFLRNSSCENLVDQNRIRSDAELLEKKLGYFGIKGEVMGIHPGPVITTYEYKPDPGIKISKIVNLADDLALALSAYSIRIVAPIPGKDVMGIEIPNAKKDLVPFVDIVTSTAFKESTSRIPICLGKDIVGNPVVVELDSMPHLLIAGATGTGKSVGLNAMITSILYKSTPDEVRFLMIDPKRIELSFYNDIGHLLTPVITDMNKANTALQWLVREMDRRYNLLAEFQVRHIEQFNQKLAASQNPLYDDYGDSLEPLPYIVVIIDELADLMMTASRDIEFSLTRLAQMARAAGIHLILATQRPSVDVLTGIIKANFPTRISFQVSSKTDSRTIIDSNGAETLLGNGDMLFVPPGTARLTRVHGTYLSEEELVNITTFIKQQRKPDYIFDVLSEQDYSDVEPAGNQDEYDEKYNEALDFVMTTRQASISGVQRALRVGYNRAARIIDLMEKNGVVGPSDGVKPRKVLVNTMNMM